MTPISMNADYLKSGKRIKVPFTSSEVELKFRLIGYFTWGKNLVRGCMQTLIQRIDKAWGLKVNDLGLFRTLDHQFDMNIELLREQILRSTSDSFVEPHMEQVLTAVEGLTAKLVVDDRTDFSNSCCKALRSLKEKSKILAQNKNENLKTTK